ncbi:hypothetical protein [Enterococcus sp. HY326]|uniref:hypothetical protein n=1 Tax=Enterococcus sp. HY326 TaxID=2971265 RepID=UPI002240C082|nr:hypothetical protein [Enterococcus sp. HY326]
MCFIIGSEIIGGADYAGFIKRKTGFFGYGSPLTLKIDGEKKLLINENQEKDFILNQTSQLEVGFYWLKSQPLTVAANQRELNLKIIMNPRLVTIYIGLFLAAFLIPLFFRYWLIIPVYLLAYGFFVMRQFKQAYIIEVVSGFDD